MVPRAFRSQPETAGEDLALPVAMKTGAHLRLMSDNTSEHPTLPPSKPFTEEPLSDGETRSALVIPPPAKIAEEHASVESWEGYDEKSFMHRATAAVIDGTNALLKARQNYDVEAIVNRQRVLFEEAIGPKLDTIAQRLTQTEGDIRDLQGLRAEFTAMKAAQAATNARMAEIERALGLKSPTT